MNELCKIQTTTALRNRKSETLEECFYFLFDFIRDNEDLKEQLLNEINHYLVSDSIRIEVKELRKHKIYNLKDTDKKIIKRDISDLKRLIQDDGTITTNEKYLKKATKILLRHFGKYEIKHIDIKCLADILNSINKIKEKKTLMFDTTTEYHSYKKSDKNKMSLKSQMESLFIEYGYCIKVTTYSNQRCKIKNSSKYSLKPFDLRRIPPPKTMYKYVTTKEVSQVINSFLKEIYVRDSRKKLSPLK